MKKLIIDTDFGKPTFDMKDGYNFTKVVNAKLFIEGEKVDLGYVSTWAGLLRSVCGVIKPIFDLDDNGGASFNAHLKGLLNTFGLKTNQSFSDKLFKDDSFVKSSVYKNNKNHCLNVWRDWNICAVYSGEVVWVLNALLFSLGDCRLEVEYFLRGEDAQESVENVVGNVVGNVDVMVRLCEGVERLCGILERMCKDGK